LVYGASATVLPSGESPETFHQISIGSWVLNYFQELAHGLAIGSLRRLPAQSFLFRCYNRFIKMVVPGSVVETNFGSKIYCEPADLIQSMIFHFRTWEPDVSAVVHRLLGPGDVMADVGANVGYDSLLASRLVGSTGSVVSIEAAPSTFEKLKSNLALNNTTNVRVLNVAVSDERGSLTLYTGNDSNIGAASAIASADRKIAVKVDALPLDELLTESERKNLRLIKMDIEGGEPIVLRRFLKTMEMYGTRTCLIVEASPQFDRSSWIELFEGFRAAGFSAYGIENSYLPVWYLNWRQPAPLRLLQRMPEQQIDILFIREELPADLSA
jgi:FkbM family methyltransferase